jgi:hypothetical protein
VKQKEYPMQNPATQSQNDLNTFTNVVKISAGHIRVRLRNGDIVYPIFYAVPADMFGLEEEFFTVHHVVGPVNFGYRWNLDGSGIKNPDFDMMEIVA